MSFEDGWAAVNLQMPARVPRVEFSADDYHFDLVKAVTGIDVNVRSPDELKLRASQAFLRAWNYDIRFDALGRDCTNDVVNSRIGGRRYGGTLPDGCDGDESYTSRNDGNPDSVHRKLLF